MFNIHRECCHSSYESHHIGKMCAKQTTTTFIYNLSIEFSKKSPQMKLTYKLEVATEQPKAKKKSTSMLGPIASCKETSEGPLCGDTSSWKYSVHGVLQLVSYHLFHGCLGTSGSFMCVSFRAGWCVVL